MRKISVEGMTGWRRTIAGRALNRILIPLAYVPSQIRDGRADFGGVRRRGLARCRMNSRDYCRGPRTRVVTAFLLWSSNSGGRVVDKPSLLSRPRNRADPVVFVFFFLCVLFLPW